MKFGFPDTAIENIQTVFEANAKVDEVIVFGSRAKGNYKEGSDIDLAVKGSNINFDDILKLHGQLDDLNLPYKIDLLDYATIKEPALVEHIDRVGIVFFERWKTFKLKQLGCKFLSGFAFKSQDYTSEGIPLIKIGNIQNRIVEIESNGDFIKEDALNKKVSDYLLDDKDVLIAMTGQGSVGRVGRLKLKSNQKALLNQRVGKFICDEKSLNIDYLYYILTTEKYQDYLFNTGSGSGQPNLSPELILDTEIPWTNYTNQLSVASILRSLDDKIDLLQRQNKTLEQLAETLFRQWFVKETNDNWEELTLYDAIELIGGGTPKTEIQEFWNGNINWLSGGDIALNHKGFVMSSEKKISEIGLKNSSANLLSKFSTVISARGTVGKYCILSKTMAFSQSNYGIKPKYKECYFFTYLLISYCVDELLASAYGSVFDTITTSTFKETKLILPSEKEIQLFENSINLYFKKMLSNTEQIKQLTQLRDALLPKLMSGEVRINL